MKSSKKSASRPDLSEEELELEIKRVREQKKSLQSGASSSAPIVPPTSKNPGFDPGDVLKAEYRFDRTEEDDAEAKESWEKQVAKHYDESLFKEYALADLSQYKVGKIGLRWRVEKEVRSGKGETICGNKSCSITSGLEKFEVPFKYREAGKDKMTLVKVTMCADCSIKLQYRSRQTSLVSRSDNPSENETKKRLQESLPEEGPPSPKKSKRS